MKSGLDQPLHIGATLRLLLFADLHLDTKFSWAGPVLARKRRQALRDTLTRILELASDVQPDLVVCGGDLYEHDRSSPDTAEFLRVSFERLHPTPVFIAPGNHDWYGRNSIYQRTTWSPNVHVFGSSELEAVSLSDGLTLWGAAHLRPAGTDNFLEDFRVDRGGVHIAVLHGSERSGLHFETEGKDPHAPFEATDIERAGLHHALLGHYHHPKDAPHHTYPGNPDPLTFGESGERGVVELEISDDGTVSRQRHTVASSAVHDVSVDVDGCATRDEVRERIQAEVAPLSGCVRVALHGELESSVALDREDFERESLAPALEALVVRADKVTVAYDFDAIANEPTVRGQFVRDVRESSLDEDTREGVLVTGLRAFEGRDDLETL